MHPRPSKKRGWRGSKKDGKSPGGVTAAIKNQRGGGGKSSAESQNPGLTRKPWSKGDSSIISEGRGKKGTNGVQMEGLISNITEVQNSEKGNRESRHQ